jgi:hypothetical protein
MPAESGTFNFAKLGQAAEYATELHAGQFRKGDSRNVPYISHLFAVSAMVMQEGGTEDQAIAALLHDAVEDRPQAGKTEVEIDNYFGPDVYDIVLDCTNNFPDKSQYLTHLDTLRPASSLVAFCDKLHNASCTTAGMRGMQGKRPVEYLNAFRGGPKKVLWYYRCLAASALFGRNSCPPLLAQRLLKEVDDMHVLAGAGPLDMNVILKEYLEAIGVDAR